MRINTTGEVGIGRTADAGIQLDIANPDTASGADCIVRISPSASAGDADAELILESKSSGEATLRFKEDGVTRGDITAFGDVDYMRFFNQTTDGELLFIGADTLSNDTYSLRYRRTSGLAPVTGITGTITSSAQKSTITGLSTTTGLVIGMVLTKTAGTGVLGTQACIQSIDSASQITVTNGQTAMTAGSITFTATPSPTTITASTTSAGTWAVDQDFARFAFANEDTNGAGDGGIKASINAYVYDTSGTGAGLDFYVSSNGTTLTKAARMTETGGLEITRTAVTSPATSDGNIYSGTYTPTITSVTNVAANTAAVCQYMRVGNVVTVSGQVTIDPTAAAPTNTEFRMSLPIASNFAATRQACGTFFGFDLGSTQAGSISASTTNDEFVFRYVANDTANRAFQFNATYLII
jgi:hypothetical protein